MAENTSPGLDGDVEKLVQLQSAKSAILRELSKVIVGQTDVIEELLTAVFARGHVLLVGVPGLAKTLLVSSLARSMKLSFKRIQFTPDLMPSDITGTTVLQDDPETRKRIFQFMPGPVFSNIVLADEINRTPPKTQAALLEAMQEKSVTVDGKPHMLDKPFFVLATQNPIEQEGTYPLPEAQLDRFMFNIRVSYPDRSDELEIMRNVSQPGFGTGTQEIKPVLTAEEIMDLQELVLRLPVSEHVLLYARELVRATRPGEVEAPDFIKQYVSWGAGPRASINLILSGKSRAALNGRFAVTPEDIKAVARPILRHRLGVNFTAQAQGIDGDAIVEKILSAVTLDERLLTAGASGT